MSDDYTPTTEQVRDIYATYVPCARGLRSGYDDFDNWLKTLKAEIRAEKEWEDPKPWWFQGHRYESNRYPGDMHHKPRTREQYEAEQEGNR